MGDIRERLDRCIRLLRREPGFAMHTGAEIGIAGAKTGDTTTARLVVLAP